MKKNEHGMTAFGDNDIDPICATNYTYNYYKICDFSYSKDVISDYISYNRVYFICG